MSHSVTRSHSRITQHFLFFKKYTFCLPSHLFTSGNVCCDPMASVPLQKSYRVYIRLVFSFTKSAPASTVSCNYLSPCVTKTCSAGQSKFKVLSLPARFGTFWCHSGTLEGRKVGKGYRHFVLCSLGNQNVNVIGNQQRNFCRISAAIFYNMQGK